MAILILRAHEKTVFSSYSIPFQPLLTFYLDRPAVIPEISARAKGLLADFGASDAAVLDVIFGKYKPGGHLPIELPSSMEAVRNQEEDVPYDSKDPSYKFGFGLSY